MKFLECQSKYSRDILINHPTHWSVFNYISNYSGTYPLPLRPHSLFRLHPLSPLQPIDKYKALLFFSYVYHWTWHYLYTII